MKLPARVRRQTQFYEFDPDSGFGLLFKKSASTKKYKKAAKKAPATAAKKQAVPPPPPLSKAQSLKVERLSRQGSISHKWQFKNDSGRWSDYDKEATKLVEVEYNAWLLQPEVFVRAVKSGDWHYSINFNKFEQTNVNHSAHKVRPIQRVPA